MTRILLTSLYYAPDSTGIGPYSTQLAEHLAATGYDVTAVTGMPHYPAWRVDAGYRRRFAVTERRGGVDVRRRWHFVPRTHSVVTRALYEGSFFASGLSMLRLERPQAILAVTPALAGGALARIAAQRFKVPYGLIVQDLTGAAAAQSGLRGGRTVAAAVRAAEGWAARGAAAVGIVAEGFRPYLEGLGVDPARIRRVRNWTQTPPAVRERDAVRATLGWSPDSVVCLHAGNMGAKQGLEHVIEAARIAAAEEPRLLFVLMGDGGQRPTLEGQAARAGLPNVRFLPLQPAAAVADVLGAADVLLVNQRASVRDMALPSKLTSYFAAGRPVVAAVASESETAAETEWSGGGIVCAPDDPRALLGAIGRIVADAGLGEHLAASARRHAREVLSREPALRSYEQLLASVLASGDGRVHLPVSLRPASTDGEREERWSA